MTDNKEKKETKSIPVRLKADMVEKLDKVCENLGVSRGEYMRVVIAKSIEKDYYEQK